MKTTKLLLLILILSGMSSCSKKEKRSQDYIPEIKIEISDALNKDAELVDYIISSENQINNISDIIEEVATNGRGLIEKDKDSLSLTEGLAVAKIMLKFYASNNELSTIIEDFDKRIKEFKSYEYISEEQIDDLSEISRIYKLRQKALEVKYKKYYTR